MAQNDEHLFILVYLTTYTIIHIKAFIEGNRIVL